MSMKSDSESNKQVLPVPPDKDSAELNKALKTIALEMNRFQNSPEEISYSNCHGQPNIIEDICKSSIQFKENQIQQLRTRLKTACDVAIVSVVLTENKLNDDLQTAASSHEKVHCLGYLDKLTREYTASAMKLEVLQMIVELGYGKLQKLYNKTPDPNLDIASKLNQIIFACGQFYANYYNKREKCKKLEIQNIQLINKINKKTEEMTLLRQALHQLRKAKEAVDEDRTIKDSHENDKSQEKSDTKSENRGVSQKELETLFSKNPAMENFNHLDSIRCLIEEQENMVSSLKSITNALNETCSSY